MKTVVSLIFLEDPPVVEDDGVLRGTVSEGVLASPDAYLRNLHLCKPASPEALVSEILKGVRQCDAIKIIATLERTIFDSLQRGRQFDAL